jgi:hypothetical protein
VGQAEKMYAAGVPAAETQYRYLTAGDTTTLATLEAMQRPS